MGCAPHDRRHREPVRSPEGEGARKNPCARSCDSRIGPSTVHAHSSAITPAGLASGAKPPRICVAPAQRERPGPIFHPKATDTHAEARRIEGDGGPGGDFGPGRPGEGSQQAPGDDIPLPELVRKLGPMMDTIPIEVSSLGDGPVADHRAGREHHGPGRARRDRHGQLVRALPRGRAGRRSSASWAAGPITLINTHWHFDHTGGNAALAGVGAKIVAHETVRNRLGTEQYMADFQMKVPPSPAAAWPVVTIGDSATLFLNGEEIHLAHVAPAHTDGDVFIHYRKANILQTGDLFSNGFFPNIDSSSGGWIGGMIAAADRILGIVDAKTKIIPGHGPAGHPRRPEGRPRHAGRGPRQDRAAGRGRQDRRRGRRRPAARRASTPDGPRGSSRARTSPGSSTAAWPSTARSRRLAPDRKTGRIEPPRRQEAAKEEETRKRRC